MLLLSYLNHSIIHEIAAATRNIFWCYVKRREWNSFMNP